ncbi:DeoR/GlpR transcriptional regulator, partial [Arthrobacter humicola]|nr:DeoR/GlpR transcriptional regulator [Arthrobacter humicola]
WDLGHGVTTPVEAKVEAKRAAVDAAERAVLVADSSKYGRFAKYRALRLAELAEVITDGALPEMAAQAITAAGIRVVRA